MGSHLLATAGSIAETALFLLAAVILATDLAAMFRRPPARPVHVIRDATLAGEIVIDPRHPGYENLAGPASRRSP